MEQVITLLATPLFFGLTLQQLLLIAVPIVVLLKLYFRGGQYTIPKVDLTGKYAVVTGGNSGIGAETVKVLCRLGCQVIIGARNRKTAEEVVKGVLSQHPSAKVEYIPLDLASRSSIECFASAVSFPHIDYLVNNAGVFGTPQRKTTKEGFEMQWGVNHVGHFYLTFLLWKKLTASSFFRITNVSSLTHKRLLGFGKEPNPDWKNINFETNYDPQMAYSRSKLYNVLFTDALAAKVGKRGLVTSLHPGTVRTDVMREIMDDGLKGKVLYILLLAVFPIWWLISKSAYEGCQTTLYTILSP